MNAQYNLGRADMLLEIAEFLSNKPKCQIACKHLIKLARVEKLYLETDMGDRRHSSSTEATVKKQTSSMRTPLRRPPRSWMMAVKEAIGLYACFAAMFALYIFVEANHG